MILKYDFKLAETRAKSRGYTFRDAWGSVKVNIAFVCFFVSLFELTVFSIIVMIGIIRAMFSSFVISSRKTCRGICSVNRDKMKEEETARW